MFELLLGAAIIALIGQLAWPAAWGWWRRPTPGAIGIGQFEPPGALASEYLIYLPNQGVSPWPLVVFLHGSGQRGHSPDILRDWGPYPYIKRASLPAIVAAPQCLPMRHWEPQAVVKFVESLASRYHVNGEQIYLVGYSMGGYGVWQTAAAHPTRFAAIVPICGGGDPDDTGSLTDFPIWAFHGERDEVVPVAESERMVEAIRAAGGSPRLTVLPNAGHGICHEVCERTDLWKWLLRQRLESR